MRTGNSGLPAVVEPPEWPVGEPEEAGFRPGLAEEVDRFREKRLPKLMGFLLLREGKLLVERYYGGTDRDTLFDVRSVTKSFTSAAVGLAFDEGWFGGVGDTVDRILPGDAFPKDSSVRGVMLRELLCMSSGLYWRTGNKLGEAFIRRLHNSKDWLRFILRLPVVPELRGRFVYRSPDSHLLSCLISAAGGVTAEELLRRRLLEPLGISRYRWERDPQGHTAGHVFLHIGMREMARFGELYLGGGKWGGLRVLPEAWISESLQPQAEGLPGFGAYGYQWWVRPLERFQMAYAWGHGGTFIMLLPELQTVAVAVSDPRVNRWRDPRTLMEQVVLRGVRS